MMRAIQQTRLTVIIPDHNEKARIAEVVSGAQKFAAEVIVVDDDSTDGTKEVTEELGARVITNNFRKGYIGAIKAGFQRAQRDVIITLDADGEHDPEDIPRLVQPILDGKADLVLGKREHITRPSERFINWLANLRVKVADSGTGFRVMKRELALKLDLKGKCTCGIFALEANSYGARIAEVPIALHPIPKERKTAWSHFWQIFYVFSWLLRPPVNSLESVIQEDAEK